MKLVNKCIKMWVQNMKKFSIFMYEANDIFSYKMCLQDLVRKGILHAG